MPAPPPPPPITDQYTSKRACRYNIILFLYKEEHFKTFKDKFISEYTLYTQTHHLALS